MADIDAVQEIFTVIRKTNTEIKNAFRIGISIADKPRPLILTMNDTETK